MKKISILALHLGYGGIERAITDLANSLVNDYIVEIVSTYKVYDKPVNRLDRKVKVIYLTDLKPNDKEFKKYLKRFRLISAFKEGLKSIKILKLKNIFLRKQELNRQLCLHLFLFRLVKWRFFAFLKKGLIILKSSETHNQQMICYLMKELLHGI